jgi:hypothetical protein
LIELYQDQQKCQATQYILIFQKNLLEIQNTNHDFVNWYKNHQLVKLFLESKKCNFIWNGSLTQSPYRDEFRYDGDFFVNIIDKGADGRHCGPKHLKNYATKTHFKGFEEE